MSNPTRLVEKTQGPLLSMNLFTVEHLQCKLANVLWASITQTSYFYSDTLEGLLAFPFNNVMLEELRILLET